MSSFAGVLVSEPTSFVIVELTGPQNNLILEGRALPYRPLTFSGGMRAEFTWYPGSPVATVQALGPDEKSTTINGMWKDRFLAGFNQFGIPILSGRTAKATYNGSDVANVRDLVELVDGFRLRGQLIEIGWDQFVRQGILVNFRQTWLRREDVEWEMEFQWINRGEPATPVTFGVRIGIIDILNQIEDAIANIQTALDAPFAFVSQITNEVNRALDILTETTAAIKSISEKTVDALLSPLETAQQTLAALQTVKDQAGAISSTFESVEARAQRVSAVAAPLALVGGDASIQEGAADGTGGVDAPAEEGEEEATGAAVAAPQTTSASETAGIGGLTQEAVLQAELTKREVRAAARSLRAIASQHSQEIEAETTRVANVKSFIASDDTDLRAVSTTFYGTPDEWKRLLIYNSLHSSQLTAGQIILVPPLTMLEETTTKESIK